MTSNPVVHIAGHNFEVLPKDANWSTAAGVYMFAHHNGRGYVILYVGQTDNFRERMRYHDRWDEAVRRGARFILATCVPRQLDRDALERQLIRQMQPPMNQMHKVR